MDCIDTKVQLIVIVRGTLTFFCRADLIFAESDVSTDLFSKLQDVVVSHMEKTLFPRFLKSHHYQEALLLLPTADLRPTEDLAFDDVAIKHGKRTLENVVPQKPKHRLSRFIFGSSSKSQPPKPQVEKSTSFSSTASLDGISYKVGSYSKSKSSD